MTATTMTRPTTTAPTTPATTVPSTTTAPATTAGTATTPSTTAALAFAATATTAGGWSAAEPGEPDPTSPEGWVFAGPDGAVVDAGSHEGLRVALKVIEGQGWEGPAGRAVLVALSARCQGWAGRRAFASHVASGMVDPGRCSRSRGARWPGSARRCGRLKCRGRICGRA